MTLAKAQPSRGLRFPSGRTDGGHKGLRAELSGRESPSPEVSRPVGICQPEGDFLGPAQFPALLTSPLDACPELGGVAQSSAPVGKAGGHAPSPYLGPPSGVLGSPHPQPEVGKWGIPSLERRKHCPCAQDPDLLCDLRQVPAPFWALVPFLRNDKAKISKVFWNLDTLGSCWELREVRGGSFLGKRTGMEAGFQRLVSLL